MEIAKWGRSTALKIPLVITKSAVFFGFLLMEFYHVYYFIHNVLLFNRKGHFSVPHPGDYVSEKIKAKYPDIDVPIKEEAELALAAEQKEDE